MSINFFKLRGALAGFSLFAVIFATLSGISMPVPFSEGLTFAPKAGATNTYFNLANGNLSLSLNNQTPNLITSNDDWTAIASVEGYKGTGLTDSFTHNYGVDPQVITWTEFANNALPSGNTTQIQANKGNPNAVNNGGLAEFDSGPYICFGFQGNVQSNPYMVFYVNTLGRTNIRMSYRVADIDSGSNNSVSQIALQYRIGSTGSFINIPAGFVPDATDPNVAGRITARNVLLPSALENQPQVQLRLILTDAAGSDGSSTPDEWIGVNNIIIGNITPTAANATVGGQVFAPSGNPLSKAAVIMYDNMGGMRQTITNPFGYYRFEGLSVGETYIFEVRSKRYAFENSVQTLFLTEDVSSLNFYANPSDFQSVQIKAADSVTELPVLKKR